MIRIGGEKIIVRGEKYIQITEIKALAHQDLPKEYTDGIPCVYLETRCTCYLSAGNGWDNVTVGYFFTENGFNNYCEHLRACGKRLGEINVKLKSENKDWHGTIEVLI